MFELKKTQVRLTNVNPRAELHGDEHHIALDLSISANLSGDVLKMFSGELRYFLYKKPDDPDLAEQADPEAATQPRFPKMSPIKWDFEGSGYKVTIDYGLGGDSDIGLHDCKVDKFVFDPQNGGTVATSFRIIAHPDTDLVGLLCDRIQQDIEITITAPEPTTVGELFNPQ